MRQEKSTDLLSDTSLVQTVDKFKIAGQMVHAKNNHFKSRNSYTVQFQEKDHDGPSYGYVLMFVNLRVKWYAVIERIDTKNWAACSPQEDNLSDILDTHGDLQALLGEHIIPGNETRCLVAIHVEDIIAQIVCVQMEGSTGIFLSRYPNSTECD